MTFPSGNTQGMDLMNFLLANRIIFIGKPIYDSVRLASGTESGGFLRVNGSPNCLAQVAQYVCSALMALELQNPNEDIMVRLSERLESLWDTASPPEPSCAAVRQQPGRSDVQHHGDHRYDERGGSAALFGSLQKKHVKPLTRTRALFRSSATSAPSLLGLCSRRR